MKRSVRCQDGTRRIRNQVFVLFLCDTANSGFDIAFIYDVLVNNFGKHDSSFRPLRPILNEVHAGLQGTLKHSVQPTGVRSRHSSAFSQQGCNHILLFSVYNRYANISLILNMPYPLSQAFLISSSPGDDGELASWLWTSSFLEPFSRRLLLLLYKVSLHGV